MDTLNPASDNKFYQKAAINNKFSSELDGFVNSCATDILKTKNNILFSILITSIKIINKDDNFNLVKFLLQLNKLNTEEIPNLNYEFYQKATDDYKFRFWLEGFIDFCATEILKIKFEQASAELKAQIIERCKGNEYGFLVLNPSIPTVTDTGLEEAFFSDIETKLLEELANAKKSIRVAVAWFTNANLFDILYAQREKGIKVELIIINDSINNNAHSLPWQMLIDLGGALYFSEQPQMMHHKFCIIDDCVLFNGSYNWTYYAEHRNEENVIFFKNKPDLVEKFAAEFERLISGLTLCKTVVPLSKLQFSHPIMFAEDIVWKVKNAKKNLKPDIKWIIGLLGFALEINPDNTDAKNMLDENSAKNQITTKKEENKTIIPSEKIAKEIQVLNDEQEKIENNNNFSKQEKQEKVDFLEKIKIIPLKGHSGTLQIQLNWNTVDDLDLHVETPEGVIFFRQKSITCNGVIGTLDVDANARTVSLSPAENVYFNNMPKGIHKIFVHFYKDRTKQNVDFVLRLLPQEGDGKLYCKTIKGEKSIVHIAEIHYEEIEKILKFKDL